MMTKQILILFTILLSINSFSQNKIQGTVKDSLTNEKLIGASVFISEMNIGVIANAQGNFVLENIPTCNIVVQCSYIGYKTQSVVLNANVCKKEVNFSLQKNIIETEEVVISGGYIGTQHENTIKINVLKTKELESIGTPTFIEKLASVPGVSFISKGTGIAKPVIRGLSMTNIVVLNNGVRLENFQSAEVHPFSIDEYGIDRIEIIKGPASLLYGSDAVGGVINILNEKPALRNTIIGDYNFSYNSVTNGFNNSFGVKGRKKDLYSGFRISHKTHADYLDGDGNFVPNTRYNEKAVKANIGISKHYGNFQILYDYINDKNGLITADSKSLILNRGRENKLWYQDLTNQILSSKNKIFIGRIKADVNFSFQNNHRELQLSEFSPEFTTVNMDIATTQYETKIFFPQVYKTDIIIGYQGMYMQVRNHDAPNIVLPNSFVTDNSVFGLAKINISKKAKIIAGIRQDFRNISTDSIFIDVDKLNKIKLDNNYSNLSYSLGAVYNVNERIILRTNFASAYRTPNLAELTQNGYHAGRYEKGNASLGNQLSYEIDFSSHFHYEYLIIDFAVFYNNIQDYIFVEKSGDTLVNGMDVFSYTQEDAMLYGGEVGVHFHPKKMDWFHYKSTFSYVVGEQKNGYLPFVPSHTINNEIKLMNKDVFKFKKAYFVIKNKIALAQNNPSSDETATDSYYLFSVGFGAKLPIAKQNVNINISVNNILNTAYYDHLSTLKYMGYYNTGRNISVSIKVPFSLVK